MSIPWVPVYSRPAVCFKEILSSHLRPRPRLLRLSVTDLCNFRCHYCMPAEGVPKLAEAMRAVFAKQTPNALLPRAVAGVRRETLILNLPGCH
jgi:hypothetical protein